MVEPRRNCPQTLKISQKSLMAMSLQDVYVPKFCKNFSFRDPRAHPCTNGVNFGVTLAYTLSINIKYFFKVMSSRTNLMANFQVKLSLAQTILMNNWCKISEQLDVIVDAKHRKHRLDPIISSSTTCCRNGSHLALKCQVRRGPHQSFENFPQP